MTAELFLDHYRYQLIQNQNRIQKTTGQRVQLTLHDLGMDWFSDLAMTRRYRRTSSGTSTDLKHVG